MAARADGHEVKNVAVHGAQYVVHAVSKLGIPVFVSNASAAQLGNAIGKFRPRQLEAMLSTYIRHLLPTFAGEEVDELLTHDPGLAPLLESFEGWMLHLTAQDLLRHGQFYKRQCPAMCEEIRGLTQALQGKTDLEHVELRLYCINLGCDLLSKLLNRGSLHTSFLAYLSSHASSQALLRMLRQLFKLLNHRRERKIADLDDMLGAGFGLGCDSFAARCPSTKRVSFGRSFQLPNGRVFDKCACIRVLVDGRQVIVESGAVGLCAGVTALSVVGGKSFAVAVNMFRALFDPAQAHHDGGVPALAVVALAAKRYRGDSCEEMARYVAKLPRASAWIFPMCTAEEAGVLESVGKHRLPVAQAQTVAHAGIDLLSTRVLLDPKLLDAGLWYDEGSAYRSFAFKTPRVVRELNKSLFRARAPACLDDEEIQAAENAVLVEGEKHVPSWLGTNFFPLTEANPNLVIASNSAQIPLLRAFQFRAAPDKATQLTSRAIDYRYIKLCEEAKQMMEKPLTVKSVSAAISNLDPHRCDYWQPENGPHKDPDKMSIEGTLNIVYAGKNASDIVYGHRSGLWSKPWLYITLRHYFP